MQNASILLKKKNQKYLTRFVQAHLRRIFLLIYRIVGNVDDAQDLTQETFIKALQRQSQLKDLDKAYAQVIRDLSTVYSIGYRPANRVRDGAWHNVTLRLIDHPDLEVRTKRGYYETRN